MSWSGAQRAFFVECFLKNGNSYVAAQREFKIRYNINYKEPDPILKEMFPNRLISIRGHIGWPARSPDLAPCDFFLWGYLKEQVYKHKPQTIEELKARITQKIKEIPPTMLNRVMEDFKKRLNECIAYEGLHLSDTIFRS